MHYLGRLISITLSYSLLVAIAERLFILIARTCIWKSRYGAEKPHTIATPDVLPSEVIKPLHDFQYSLVEPIKYRPFETKRHIVMGITKSTKSEWIRIDRLYLERMTLRASLLDQYPDVCMGHNEASRPAIRELYREVMLDLLPKRYPSIFRIVGDKFFNLATSSSHRISSALKDPTLMLRHLGENVEEDFYFMVPGSPEFVLEGFVSCFPQGLLPPAKVGMSVSEIHQPVPSYEGRLKKGVNRCFERMERGQTIGRPNWAIQCNHDVLHLPFDGANTIKADDSPSKKLGIDPFASFLRVEHHTLTCLPQTGTIVFAVRTYLTPLTQIKSEGSGIALAEACESMPEKFGVYKNRPTWGETLCAWLRDDTSHAKAETHEAPPVTATCPFATSSPQEGRCPLAP